MARIALIALAILALALARPAHACMASGPEGYVSGLVWGHPPSDIPVDAFLLEVEVGRSIPGSWMGFVAEVRDGPINMVGNVYRFTPESASSCIGLGREKGFMVVRRDVVRWRQDGEERAALAVVDYEESWFNAFVRFFGASQWTYPGDPAEPLGF